ncbi:MAG: GTPase HflX [Spirochaetaceae bacterium]|jgi:GTP-binding protein HflX|nr:GTPase HflX [Spirochaetaceae bacterium]
MKRLIDNQEKPKRALLVGIRDERISKEESDSLSAELADLADTLGFEIAGEEMVRAREHTSQFGMGTGKAQEIAEKAAELGVDCVVFDRDISPSLQRNWEKLTGIAAVDRQELIIRIFSQRARTREAELQVALAEQTYSLPRLTHKYIDLSRQRGGRYGTKGSGETRLETDRRLALRRIQRLREELAEVRKQRTVQRNKRRKAGVPSCALVGYTNAGKSSLFNALTLPGEAAPGKGVLVEDKLFATLDPTVRRMKTGGGAAVLLIDTVGFIRRLPHDLVDAFRATLEEAALADVLIHVLDAADPAADRYYETTMAVLRDLEADRIPMIVVLNKVDRLDGRTAGAGPDVLEELQSRYPGGVPVSARDRRGLDELVRRVEALLPPSLPGQAYR